MSTLASPTRSPPRPFTLAQTDAARECLARLVATHGHAAHHVAIAGVIGLLWAIATLSQDAGPVVAKSASGHLRLCRPASGAAGQP
jgi:hypothetical protein